MPRIVIALLALGAADVADAAIFPVGSGQGCGYATLQAAVDHAQTYEGVTPDVIRVSRTLAYTAQAVKIGNQTVEIVGGFDDCLDSTPGGTTTLSGAGGGADSVIQIQSDGRVVLRHLTISGGDEPDDAYGGGVDFRGNGVLELRDGAVINNRAGWGGGIYAVGTGPDAELILGANVTISANEAARGGGGLLVEGLEMTMIEPGTVVAFNKSLGTAGPGEGGGLLLRSGNGRPGYGYIGSAGQGGLGAFYANEARYGGAIAVVGGNEAGREVVLKLFSVSHAAPLLLRENRAAVGGGALYLRPDKDATAGDSEATAEVWHTELIANRAPNGAAAYLDWETNGVGYPGGSTLRFNEGTPHPASIGCPTGQACGRIVEHVTRDASGNPTDGAILHAGYDSQIRGRRVQWSDNHGGRLVHASGELYPALELQDALLSGNVVSAELVRVEGESPFLTLERSTIADNTIGAAHVLSGDADKVLRELLVAQPGKTTLASSGGTLAVENVIASEVASLGGPPLAVLAAPRFTDPARGDYGLRAASLAVDFAAAVAGDDRDLHGAPRDQDVPVHVNLRGPRDVGAFERPGLLPLLLNTQFHDDLRLWVSLVDVYASWDGTLDVDGDSASGSLKVQRADPPQARVVGAAQCIHLPGPARYALNGYGRTAPNTIGNRDTVLLHWELRADGGEACDTGVPLRSGDLVLTTGSTWARAPTPAEIEINGAEWTRNSSLRVQLVVVDAGAQINPEAIGWFDGLTLELAGAAPGPLLKDGFES